MTKEDTKDFFRYTLGDKSHMNLIGRVVFSPIVVLLWALWSVLDFLFAKKEER